MVDKITLTNLANLQNEITAVTAINNNNAELTDAINNSLSRDGTTPNSMGSNLDMNGFDILNLPSPSSIHSPARLIDVTSNPTITVPSVGTSGHTVPFLDGNNTWSGTNTFSSGISNSSLVTMASNTVKGTLGGGSPSDLSKSQLTTLVNPFTSTLSGAVPGSGGGTVNFLRADGTFAPPGTRILLNTITASNSATVSDVTSLTSNFNEYEISLENIVPATTANTLNLQVHATGTFKNTAYITNTAIFATAVTFAIPTTQIQLSGTSTVINTTGSGLSGTIRVFTPALGNSGKVWYAATSHLSSSSTIVTNEVSGLWNDPTALDGFQIFFASGNITSGTVKIYGLV